MSLPINLRDKQKQFVKDAKDIDDLLRKLMLTYPAYGASDKATISAEADKMKLIRNKLSSYVRDRCTSYRRYGLDNIVGKTK